MGSKSEEEHMHTLQTLLYKLHEAGLAISLDKCIFGVDNLEFLGYKVDSKGITPLPKKLSAISNFPAPKKPKHLLGYLGALNYYRRCLPKTDGKTPAEILQPLYTAATKALPPKTTFVQHWNDNKLQESFELSKRMIMKAAQLIHPDPTAPIALTTDASKSAIGGVLEQFVNGHWQPLGFWSRHLKESQQNWSTFKRELYAIQPAMRHFQVETDGRHLIVFTDHKPILGAFKAPNTQPYDPIAQQHIQEISNFTNDIRYVEGKSNAVADWLSRPPEVPIGAAYNSPDLTLESSTLVTASGEEPVMAAAMESLATEIISHSQLAEAQKKCPDSYNHRRGNKPKSVNMADVPYSPSTSLYCEVSTERARPLVPSQWRQTVIRLYHKITHSGQKDTVKKVSTAYYWPGLKKDVSNFVSRCQDCQAVKPFKTIRPVRGNIPVPDKRFSHLQVDIVGPLPPSEGHRYLLTVLDRTSRWIEALPLTEANSDSCARAFIRGWVKNL